MTLRLRYPGYCLPFPARPALGPDTASALYEPASAVYDEATNQTIVTVRPLTGDERTTEVRRLMAEQTVKKHLQHLFVGTPQ